MLTFFHKNRIWLGAVLALIGTLLLPFCSALVQGYPLWGKLVACAVFMAASYWMIRGALGRMTMRLFWFSLIGGYILALFTVVGCQVYTAMHFALTIGNLLLSLLLALGICPVFVSSIAMLLFCIPRWREKMANSRMNKWRLNPANMRFSAGFFLIWGILLLFWLPAYLGFFPGIWGYDMHNQTFQALTHHYNTFQPLLHTLFFEGTYRLGLALFGSATAGVALFTAYQTLVLSGCLAGVCCYLARRLKTPLVITLLAVAFFAILPFNAILAVSSTKDTVFTGMFLVTLLQVYDLCMEPAAFLHAIKRILLFLVSAALTCMLRNNALYALIFLLPFAVVCIKEKRLLVGGVLAVAIVLAVVGKAGLTKAVNAGDGRRIEMLSVPIQQVARVYTLRENQLTDEEKDAITAYLPEEALKNYYPFLADPVKDNCNIGDGAPSIKGFLGVWANLLKQYPNDYVDAFFLMNLGYWYPEETFHSHIYDGYDEPDTEESLGYQYTGFMESISPDVQKRSLWPAAENYYNFFAHKNAHETVPGFKLLFAPGAYCWLLYFAILALLYYRSIRLAVPLALPLGIWLTLLLGPCLVIRYAYPLMALCPLLVGVLFNGTDEYALSQPQPAGDGAGRGGEVIRFTIAGGLGFVIDYGLMILLKETFGMHYLLATTLSFIVSVVVNYLLCAYWVFQGTDTKSGGVKLAFIVTSGIGLGLNALFMYLFVDVMHINYMIAKIISVILVMIWNYFSKRKVLTGKEKKTEDAV